MENYQEDWSIDSQDDSPVEDIESQSTREKIVESLVDDFVNELREAHKQKYDTEKAELTAALCLDAQREIAEFLAEAELLAKEKKSLVDSIQAEAYFKYKDLPDVNGKKLTEAALSHKVAKDIEVISSKKEQYIAEANYNKWRNLFSTLKDGHIYFRGLAKGKNEF